MLKGRTRIELRDVRTGRTQTVEEDNMVTNALQYVFNPLGYVKAGDPMFTSAYVDYFKTLTGGLLLLGDTVPENADTVILPRNTSVTGCAVYDQQNTSGQTLRGNYNATESEIDKENRRVKFVYDFDTSEANGTIACVALTHAYGGYGPRGCSRDPEYGLYPFFSSVGSGLLRLTGSNSGIGAYDRRQDYTVYGSSYQWIVKIEADTDSVYYFSIVDGTTVRIRRYRANISTVSLFEAPGSSRTLLESRDVKLGTEINTRYFSYNYDEESDRLYVVTAADYSVSDGKDYVVTEIDMSDCSTVKQYTMTNTAGVSIRTGYEKCDTVCYEGYVYFMNYGGSERHIYRQEIGNSANVQVLQEPAALRQAFPMLARDGRVYFETPTGYSGKGGCYVVDVDSFTMKYTETYSLYDFSVRQFVPVRGVPLTYYVTAGASNGTFAVRTDYLATINNLATPVVKTADRTMKVTYTLQEQ